MNNLSQNILLAILLFLCQFSWGQSQTNESAKTIVIDRTETCRSNPKNSYQIFIPSVDTSFKQMPLFVSIDSHGDGQLAIAGFKEAARKYQVVVVGSNVIKNNDPNYIQELDELIADVRSRFPVGRNLYLGGFSGGARMALGYATNHKPDGVLACGALAQTEEIHAIQCKIMCIIGMDDFNFIEAAPFIVDPMAMPSNLAIETTKASHSWPGKDQLQRAMGYMVLSVIPPGTLAEKRKYVQEFVAEQKLRIDQLDKSNESIQAALTARNMMSCPIFERETTFMTIADQKVNTPNCKNQLAELQKDLQFEAKVRNSYYSALTQKDSTWWKPEIELLNSKITTEKNEFSQQTYKRIKGFLGIVCFSLCNRYEQEKDIADLEKVLFVYRSIEPGNPDMLQFSKTLGQLKKKH
jgi:hypothetical protein